MNDHETAIALFDNDANFSIQLTDTKNDMFTSLKADTMEEKAMLFKAMNNPDFRLGDMINKTIEVCDVFCETVTCVNKQTGEPQKAPRIVLIDKNGKSYQAVSLGVFSALKKIIAVFGAPHWDTPIKLQINQVTIGERKMLTFGIAN